MVRSNVKQHYNKPCRVCTFVFSTSKSCFLSLHKCYELV